MSSKNRIIIGLAGLGTVGSGLVEMLAQNKADIFQRTGKEIVVKSIAVRDTSKPRQVHTGAVLVTDPLSLANDPEIQIVVELIGGQKEAKQLICSALENGKCVVTANKALLAEQGEEIFNLAAEKGLGLGYEASIAGAIPIVQTIKDSLSGNQICSIMGILNGTSNFILSEMTKHATGFNQALAQAQELGYAEADPSLDVDGFDAAHKLALLVRLAWGRHYPFEKMSVNGIRDIKSQDIEIAKEFGYRIKLIGQARKTDDKIEAGVFLSLIHHTLLLAKVGGAYNAVRIEGNAAGSLFFHGLGAGSKPTASAVLADILSLTHGNAPNNTGFTVQGRMPEVEILPSDQAVSPWYIRMTVDDNPGVLRDIAGAMADERVSIAQVIQKSAEQNGVPVVFMTHATTGKAIMQVVEKLKESGLILEPAITYRVLGVNETNAFVD